MEICSNGHVIVRDDHSRFDYIPGGNEDNQFRNDPCWNRH